MKNDFFTLLKRCTFGIVLVMACFQTKASDTTIYRNVDVTKTTRDFPKLVNFLNTSLQKSPAPALAKLAREEYGKPAITRCWLNLDEMWDYRTRQYNYNYKIGVDKYKDIPQKHRETWDWEIESPNNFYDYMQAFSAESEEIMLTIRRYEKDIITKSLPVTMKDWKMIFKAGLKHYKQKYPNIRYIEVCNEYELKGFMDGTNEQYYEFYKLGYEAVNEINKELKLTGKNKLLVGGPVSTGNFLDRIDAFMNNFKEDKNASKTLDFISWHEYTKPLAGTAHRQGVIQSLLDKYGLDRNMPLFISEHDPYHYSSDSDERHFSNTATLVKTLYFSNLYSPSMYIFPWVLYHNENLQTRFMWFKGPNEPNTAASDLKMLPTGVSMKILSMHAGKEVHVKNDIEDSDIVLVSKTDRKILVQVVNYTASRPVQIILNQLEDNNAAGYKIKTYVIDEQHNNLFTNKDFVGRLTATSTKENVNAHDKSILLRYPNLGKYGTVCWEISW